jgi:predicted phosphodiesterase
MVESDKKDTVTVHYGTSIKYEKTAKTAFYLQTSVGTYMHRVKISDLVDSSTYFYFATQGTDKSEDASFRSSIPSGAFFRFAAMGDCRSNPDIHRSIAREIKKHNPYFSLYAGDLNFNGKYGDWKEEFFVNTELDLSASAPFYNAIGNHEQWTQDTKAFQQAPDSKSYKQEYYSFDYADLHILVLSTQHTFTEGSDQYKFAEADLRETKAKWKIVIFHEPAYCSGSRGENKKMQKVSEQLFEPNKVDIVIAGHTHFYQHNLVKGIHHFILGGAGAPLYDYKEANYTIKSAKTFHYAIFDANFNRIKCTVYDLYGKEIDNLELSK